MNLIEQIKETFEVPPETQIKLCHRGKLIHELPSSNNAIIHASVLSSSSSGFKFSKEGEEIPFRDEILEAFNFIRDKLTDSKNEKTRENIVETIKTALSKRYVNHREICKNDQYGARCASSYDLFLDCLRIKVLRKRQAIQELLLAIYAGIKDAKIEEPVVRDVSDHSFAQPRSVVPLIQTLTSDSEPQLREQGRGPQTSGTMPGPITTDMLRRALIATEEQMRQTGQTVESMVQLTPENRNIESAAQEILAEIAALATNVENGLEKLREMGLVDSIGEDAARRILQDMGGDIDATIESIMQNWDKLQKE